MSDLTLIPKRYKNVTPHDTESLGVTIGLFVGGAGNVVVRGVDGVLATFAAGAGQYLTGQFAVVTLATTATGIVALYGN